MSINIDGLAQVFNGYAGTTYRADGDELRITVAEGSSQTPTEISGSRIAEELANLVDCAKPSALHGVIERFVTDHFGTGNGGLVGALEGALAQPPIDRIADVFAGYAGGTVTVDGAPLDLVVSEDGGSHQSDGEISETRLAEMLDSALDGVPAREIHSTIERFVSEHFGAGNDGLVQRLDELVRG